MLKIETAKVFEPLLARARYKGAWGGRGSGKSHFFAGSVVRSLLGGFNRRALDTRISAPFSAPPCCALLVWKHQLPP
jgi:hypothetical protein